MTFRAPGGRLIVQAVFLGDANARAVIGRKFNRELVSACRKAARALSVSSNSTESVLRERLGLPADPTNLCAALNQPLLARLLITNPDQGWNTLRGYLRAVAREAAFTVSQRS